MPKKYKQLTQTMDTNNDGKLSDQEINNAIMILNKVKQQNKKISNPNHF